MKSGDTMHKKQKEFVNSGEVNRPKHHYLDNRTGGSILFVSPAKPGSYDLRMHDTDNNGREVASVSLKSGAEG